jgi:hypothetical protein
MCKYGPELNFLFDKIRREVFNYELFRKYKLHYSNLSKKKQLFVKKLINKTKEDI